MNLQKIKTLIEFAGRSSVSKLGVRDRGLTLRFTKAQPAVAALPDVAPMQSNPVMDLSRFISASSSLFGGFLLELSG